jgi:hypothetical protein
MILSMRMKVRAVNTAPESENRIHDDRVAAEYGFRGGLVPGVTVYGYMASAAVEHYGEDWLQRGAMDVRFREPFYEGEDVEISSVENPEGRIGIEAGSRASGIAWLLDAPPVGEFPELAPLQRAGASRATIRAGCVLGSFEKTLDLTQPGLSAPFDAFVGARRLAHPAIMLGLANELLMQNYELGPWIHAASEVRNAQAARDGERLQVRGKIVDAYERKGHEFVVLDVAILSGEGLVSRVRHTAIWKPRK